MESSVKLKSKALEVNLADYHVEVAIDPRYAPLQEVMSRYFGLMDGVATFLRELSHPYMNWRFVTGEARKYALDYFHLFREHAAGPKASALMMEILLNAIRAAKEPDVKADAMDNLLLYLQKILKDAGTARDRFLPCVAAAFDEILSLPREDFTLFVRSFYSIKRVAATFLERTADSRPDAASLNRLLIAYLEQTYAYWLSESDPKVWFDREAAEFGPTGAFEDLFQEVSHRQIETWRQQLGDLKRRAPLQAWETTAALMDWPGYNHFIEAYKKIPQQMLKRGQPHGRGHHLKLVCLFQIMNVSGLALIHEETLREINQTLTWIIVNEGYRNIQNLIRKTFSILTERAEAYPATALNCILNVGKGIYKKDDLDLVNFFINALVDFGFHAPMVQGVDDLWQTRVNSAHILNMRTWLELIKLNPKRSTRLLSALIIHLSLSGVFIRDIDLFPRDITGLLNSRIGPAYNLVKQLCRLFPAFFNDIGAEGRLRDISTRIDELTHRRDRLIHFLRKQSHVESSNRIIPLMEAVFRFWQTRRTEDLESWLPPVIFEQIDPAGAHVGGMHALVQHLLLKGVRIPEDFLVLPGGELRRLLAQVPGVSAVDTERFELAAELFKLLSQKYTFDFVELENYLAQLRPEALPEMNRLEKALAEPESGRRLARILDYVEKLKAVILSETSYEIREDIYQKRHITVDIPSMYGSYHEMKFDCLGLTLRLESMVNVLFENLIRDIDLSLITKATFYEIYGLLRLFDKALRLDGISSAEFERQLEFLEHSLEVRGFTLTQYLDIFKGFTQAVQNIVNDGLHNIHGLNLSRILANLSTDRLLPKFLPAEPIEDREKLQHRICEIFYRDQIASSLGLQQLDLFLSRILNTLFQQSYKLPKDKLHKLLLYDPQHAMAELGPGSGQPLGVILLGTKGLILAKLNRLRYRVPPGFIITTEVFRCREVIESYPPAEKNFKEQVARRIAVLEKKTGKRFGDPKNPLLLSVRSGASISQPGMMDTLLNVGNNEAITAAVAERMGNPWFAWDNYRRFLQSYGMAHGLKRDDFDAIIGDYKRRLGLSLKRQFTGAQMREVALDYKRMVRDSGIEILDTPYDQLHLAIRTVLGSWESAKARAYRRIMGISDDWGTAVVVQAMVYGNLCPSSGTGVVFTHNPRWSGDELRLWGDFTTANQGEDVVSGLVRTMPISIFQQEIEMRDTDVTLETHFPDIYRELKSWAHELIDDHGWSPQEIEFTFESPAGADLYMLQTRDMAIRESKKVLQFDDDSRSERLLGHGIGVSGGAMSGRLVFSLEEIEVWRASEPQTHLILARADTVPDDIREIHAADGLLTERGGLTSHAAVVAHRLGKTCVVGCVSLVCSERNGTCQFNGKVTLKSGDFISIDGKEGTVFSGLIKLKAA